MSGRGDDRIEGAGGVIPLRAIPDPADRPERTDRRVSRCCVTCRFWEPTREFPAIPADDQGECHIAPPVVIPNLGARWPETSAVAWCGMWQHDRRGTQPEEHHSSRSAQD